MRQKLEIGNKLILIQRPMFVLTEKLVQKHGLKQNKVFIPGDIPVVPLNFVVLSLEGPYNRDTVEGCVKETLLFLSRSISIKQHVEFVFKGIGVLVIKDDKVKMRFFKDFLCTMDGSGALVDVLANRPGTVDSVLSHEGDIRRCPSNVLAFPRIEFKEAENKPLMETIIEEGGKNRQTKSKLKDKSNNGDTREIFSPEKPKDRAVFSPAREAGVNSQNKAKQKEKLMSPECISPPGCLKNDNGMKPKSSPDPGCRGHNKAGQELCYLCLQRAQRNTPLYYSEERRRREIDDEQIIQQYQIWKDQEAIFKQQMKNLAVREQNKKNAAYNLGVAEAMRLHKNEKRKFYKSFLFDKRPLSSEINAFKQEEYSQSLLRQMDNRREKAIKQRQNKELMDRLEQVQLTEELAAQRAKYIKDKMEERLCYKRALDTQIRNKPPQLPVFESDSSEPIFGKKESELWAGQRQREQEYMQHQVDTAAGQRRKAILHQLTNQKRDLQMLQKTHTEYLADKRAELERVNRINQSLQKDWEKNAEMKRQRDLEAKAFERASDKLFLLDQCQQYQRCKQCQRRTSYRGESSLWPLNKYLQGSRLLV
ncbi:coiled-coil domain-containing protein 81 [Talpa occidentalis]|uniref:coiled-coil domain-containing protein 81 n=1 Tax=Talpa occidentalis TaxID=50954 RepID=UPI0023F73D00|nr:coiled-coil domain-containing protein 81 [Talpa occidentalis]